ncbi:hypothetical protein SH2C18_48010 [Clostridium sediminicola]|uniref:hypothetical protein n=1 Tax=Clostridium sediminicola TaxID=3114879 RepID=UPI0031F22C38
MDKLKENHNNVFNFKYISVAIIVTLLNSFFYDSFIIMLLLVVIQSLILIRCLIHNQDVKYISYYIIFLSTSMESASYVGADVFYGFKEFRIAGVNLGVIFLLILLIKFVLNGEIQHPYKSKGYAGKFMKGVFILTPIGIFMGLFNLLMNDNDILIKMTSIGMFIDASYIFIFVSIEVIVIYTVIRCNIKDINEIKQSLVAIIISLAITLVTCMLLENYGNRGGLNSLQVSNIIMLLGCAIIIPFYQDYHKNEKIILVISTMIILVLGLMYNTNGKMIIIMAIIPVIIITILLKRKMYRTVILTLLSGIFIIYFTFNNILPSMCNNSLLLSTKLEQVSGMLSVDNEWFKNMPSSPKMRISQFLNITSEYIEKPWFIFTGKGYLGTIEDNLSLFGYVDEFAYSKWQIENALYHKMHETLNTFYLANGMIGIIFFLWVLKNIVSKIHKSPWMVIGGFWFVLFYAYSLTISIFGVTALIIAFMDIDYKEINYLNYKNGDKLVKNELSI